MTYLSTVNVARQWRTLKPLSLSLSSVTLLTRSSLHRCQGWDVGPSGTICLLGGGLLNPVSKLLLRGLDKFRKSPDIQVLFNAVCQRCSEIMKASTSEIFSV